MKRFKVFFTIMSNFMLLGSFAQSEIGLYNFNSVHQSSFYNPSAHSDYKFSMGMPIIGSIYAGAGNTGFSIFKDYIDSLSDNKTTYWTKGRFVDQLKDKNMLYYNSSIDLLSFRVKARHSFYSFAITDKQEFRFLYPKDLFMVFRDGNSGYIGDEVVLTDLRVNSQIFREFAFGYQHEEAKQKWSYGFRLKLLQGLASFHTSKSTTSMSVAPDSSQGNDLTVTSDVRINTSYNKSLEDLNIDMSDPMAALRKTSKIIFTDFTNLGVAVDVGGSLKINKRLKVSGSINNLGFIRWKENPQNYKFTGEAKFEGVKFRDLNTNDTNKLNFQTVLDSLAGRFNVDSTRDSYSSSLVGSTTVSLTYKLFRNTEFNAVAFANYYHGIRLAASIGLQQKIARWFAVTAYWSAQFNKYDNVGAGIMIKPGPIQYYVLCDNFVPFLKARDGDAIDLTKLDFRNSNIRFGMNIAIGRVKDPEAQTFSDN